MNRLIKKLEDIMVAITFAEAGEFDEASRQSGNLQDRNQEDPGRPFQGLEKRAIGSTGK